MGISNGKDILGTLYELIMSIYNKEVMTKIHPKFHVDIFIVEVSGSSGVGCLIIGMRMIESYHLKRINNVNNNF